MTLSASVAGLLLGAHLAHAQVPLVSVDLLAGAGAHTTAGGVYTSEPVPTLRIATTVRLGTSAATRPVLKIELEPRGQVVGNTGSSGPRSFPPVGGVSYALGVLHVTSSDVAVGFAVGGGRYGGPYTGTRHDSVFGEAELAWQMLGHVGLVTNTQYRQWHANGTRFWYAPTTVGFAFSSVHRHGTFAAPTLRPR